MYAQFTYSAFFMLFGAVLLSLGFWRHSAFLRWQALVLLAVAIGKVFLVDMSALSQGYRILSFLGLGRTAAGGQLRLSAGLAPSTCSGRPTRVKFPAAFLLFAAATVSPDIRYFQYQRTVENTPQQRQLRPASHSMPRCLPMPRRDWRTCDFIATARKLPTWCTCCPPRLRPNRRSNC